jgi:hypothetical protein
MNFNTLFFLLIRTIGRGQHESIHNTKPVDLGGPLEAGDDYVVISAPLRRGAAGGVVDWRCRREGSLTGLSKGKVSVALYGAIASHVLIDLTNTNVT